MLSEGVVTVRQIHSRGFERYRLITSTVESGTFCVPAAPVTFGSRLYTKRILGWHGFSLSLVQDPFGRGFFAHIKRWTFNDPGCNNCQ
jgi:hypothetical protein